MKKVAQKRPQAFLSNKSKILFPLKIPGNDDRRQWRKQGVAVGAAASKTQAKRCGCWVPQPGQWHAVRRDGEVYFLLFLYCSGPTPIVSRKTRRKWAAEAKPVCSATLPMLSSVVSRSFCAASMRRALM